MPPSIIKVLLIEDNPGDARLLQEALAEVAELRFEFTPCDTLTQALQSLAKGKPDVCLVDLGLPDAQGLEAVRGIHSKAADVPLVVLTGMNDETLAIHALKEGAQDYLVKAHIDPGAIWRAIRYAMERQRLHLELLSFSLIDDLTGLHNRRGFLTLAEHHVSVAYRTGKSFLVAFIDLDGMKQINDTFGHQEGDRALVDTGNALRDCFRQSDILARLGGDEFAVLIAEASNESIETIVHRIEQRLASLNASPGRQYALSFSIGTVTADLTQPVNLAELLSRADALMYQQKQSKRRAITTASGRT
jgi:diguanylate cyclase (GGDEF)-like protein